MTGHSSHERARHALDGSAAEGAPVTRPPLASWLLGCAFLLLAIVMSAMLVMEHTGLVALPGCGPRSACAEAAASIWGKVPGTSWPLAFLGLAYFSGATVLWLGSRSARPAGLSWMVRAGVLASAWLILVMVREGRLCPYCLGVHAANIAFWIVAERGSPLRRPRPRLLVSAASVFVLVSIALGLMARESRRALLEQGQRDLTESTTRIIEATTDVGQAGEDVSQASARGFRGRHLLGPEAAAVRIVLFTDYQCTDCRRIESQVRSLVAEHDEVSVSVKHFPYCKDCNPTVGRTLHANACWAARAAETAGILWGAEGFWRMHHWLFEKGGVFTTEAELAAGIRQMGYAPQGFIDVMRSEQTLENIRADISEARALGLFQTPMIFVNGVELRGWHVPDALVRTVEAVLSRNPPLRTHADDRPPLAVEKCIGDWLDPSNPVRHMPRDEHRWPLGSERATVQIVMFGDYQEPGGSEADAIIRSWMEGRTDTSYVYRHFPVDRACNPHVTETKMPRGCWAASTAEAAGVIGGADGYWRMHAWLMSHQGSFVDATLRGEGAELGLDVEALVAARGRTTVDEAVREDVSAGKHLGLREVPTLFVNGRQIRRWRWLGSEVARRILRGILDAAASGS